MVMTGESFENYIPRLVPFVRGPLWRVKLQRPSLYRALRPMVWVAYFAAVATLAQPGWVEFAVTHLMWSHVGAVLGLYIVAIMFAALALASGSALSRFIMQRLFESNARKVSHEERMRIARALVRDAFALDVDVFVAHDQVDRWVAAGCKASSLANEVRSAIEHLKKHAEETGIKLISENERDYFQALRKLLGDDPLSLKNKRLAVDRAVLGMESKLIRAERKAQLESAKNDAGSEGSQVQSDKVALE